MLQMLSKHKAKGRATPGFSKLVCASRELCLPSESAVLSAMGSLFHSLGARREKSLGRVDRCPGFFSEGSISFPVLADLSERVGL